MGPSPVKPGLDKSPGADGVFYGVYLPPDVHPTEYTENSIVFTDKSEALKVAKKYKKARFKAFATSVDAMKFAVYGLEITSPTPLVPVDVGEKPSPFRGPKPQDMVRFRKAIEAGDFDFVKKTVWENPRYLVSSGDTPSILQEGSRYNALHIAAKSRDATICAYVLQTVNSVEFMRHFYGEATDLEERCAVLLDLYLNTPDKALNETPLHFSAKFGAAPVVKVLVAYPQCDRTARNKFHQTAKDVICSRIATADVALRDEIALMLEEQFFVPVLRSPDASLQPVVGKLFSPSSPLRCDERNGTDVTSPRLQVNAVAGPMPRQTAELFRRRWKTPPRSPHSPRPTLTDQDKGWETVGRELAQEWKVPWKEYWPFLKTYTDLNSQEGLQMLEDYLRNRFKTASEGSLPTTPSATTPTTMTGTPSQSPAESPMSELCSALRACRLSRGSGPKPPRHRPPSRPAPAPAAPHHSYHNGDARHDDLLQLFTSPHLYVEKSCQVFAKRIATGFQLSDDLDFLFAELKRLAGLAASCQSDNRFGRIAFNRLHGRLGQLVGERLDPNDVQRVNETLRSFVSRYSRLNSNHVQIRPIEVSKTMRVKESLQSLIKRFVYSRAEECNSSDEDDLLDSPFGRHPRLDLEEKRTLQVATVCLARAIINAASLAQEAGDQVQPLSSESLTTEEACSDAWTRADACTCTFMTKRPSRRKWPNKRLNFNDDEFALGVDESNVEGAKDCEMLASPCANAPADSSGEESDTSDTSESEFFTPPSSPGLRSDDDQAMESTDEGPDVYIDGNVPSKLDLDVMAAIRGTELSKAKLPNICRWLHLVQLHSEKERQSWVSSPVHKTPSKNHSPAQWHQTPSLRFD